MHAFYQAHGSFNNIIYFVSALLHVIGVDFDRHIYGPLHYYTHTFT